jgi:hypothetical protein
LQKAFIDLTFIAMKFKCFIVLILSCSALLGQNLKRTDSARIEFVSEAPLELIKAVSSQCMGVLDLSKHEFAFRVRVRSFEGFNSPLQKEHFNENYMESDVFPNALFTGRIIDDVDLTEPGEYKVRVKGQLTIHDVIDERVISISLKVCKDKSIDFSGQFNVDLESHKIKVPRIVYQKIAETIDVTVKGTLR